MQQNSYPTLNVGDVLVVVHRDFIDGAYISAKSLSPGFAFTLEAYFGVDVLDAAAAATAAYSITLKGVTVNYDIPQGGNIQHQVSRVLVTSGSAEVDIVSPGDFRSYLEGVPPLPNY